MSLLTKTLLFACPGSFQKYTPPVLISVRNYAARKGTRERKNKKKVKVEEVKVGFIPHNLRGLDKMLASRKSRKFDDSWKQVTTDNVYPMKYYRWRVYSFTEAVQCHRETHHPTMYNEPNAPLKIVVELNMQGEKKTRFLDNFTRVAPIPYPFDHGEERNIIVFAKDSTTQEAAKEAGAALVGGSELVKEIQTGALSLQDFKYTIAHPNILPELVSLRGLLKKRFPNQKNATLNVDVVAAVKQYLYGINYRAVKDEYEKDFGLMETSLGPLSMDIEHLEGNFEALVKDLDSAKPKKAGSLIRRVLLVSPPCSERLLVNYEPCLESGENDANAEADDDDEEPKRATA